MGPGDPHRVMIIYYQTIISLMIVSCEDSHNRITNKFVVTSLAGRRQEFRAGALETCPVRFATAAGPPRGDFPALLWPGACAPLPCARHPRRTAVVQARRFRPDGRAQRSRNRWSGPFAASRRGRWLIGRRPGFRRYTFATRVRPRGQTSAPRRPLRIPPESRAASVPPNDRGRLGVAETAAFCRRTRGADGPQGLSLIHI